MKKILKYIGLVAALTICNNSYSSAQSGDRKILYFLADTINVAKENRVLDLIHNNAGGHVYVFYCKCVPPYKFNVSFSYRSNEAKTALFNQKPNLPYVSWKELSDIFSKNENRFDAYYQLYIVELLPNKQFMLNKVKFVRNDIDHILYNIQVIPSVKQ